MELSPWIVGLAPLATILIPDKCWRLDILAVKAGRFFGS
jgi:hypothetical protein